MLGGSPYNVAIGLARLGSQTAFVSRISADGNGEALAAGLAANGVDLPSSLRDMRPTTLAFVMRGTAKTGSRYSFYLDATAFDGPWPFPATGRKTRAHLHVGSILRGRPAAWRSGGRGAEGRAPARDRELRSQHPTLGHAGRASGQRFWSNGRSRSPMWSRRARKTCSGSTPAAPSRKASPPGPRWVPRFCVATLGERGAARRPRQGADRGRRSAQSRSSTRSARATVSCPPCSRRWIMIMRSAPRRQRRTAPRAREMAQRSPRPPRRSLAPARAPIRRPAPKSRRPSGRRV